MAERGLAMDHTTIFRWDPSVRTRGASAAAGQLKLRSSTWHVDETFVRIAARWLYLFLAVDSRCQTVDVYLSETREREAAKCFLGKPRRIPAISATRVRTRWFTKLSRRDPRPAG